MSKLILIVSVLVSTFYAYAYHNGNLTGKYVLRQVITTDIDLIHGRIIVIGKYLYHGDFDGNVWLDPSQPHAATLYRRNIDDLSQVQKLTFPNDYLHQNIIEVQYNPNQNYLYVLFMGGQIAQVDIDTMTYSDFNYGMDISARSEMGKIIMHPLYLYRISQTSPYTIVTQYELHTGKQLRQVFLPIPGGHGGIYFDNKVYVTTNQNDGNGAMIYILNSEDLTLQSEHRIRDCENIAPDFAVLRNYAEHPYLFFGCEGLNQNFSLINNIIGADATNPSYYIIYNTNTAVTGGIWGVTERYQRIWITRGSSPATIEAVDPWAAKSVFYQLPNTLHGANGGVEVIGNKVYFKVFPRIMGAATYSSLGVIEVE